MAEYAGLEIRIGGNTTKLNNALNASTKSAAELQSRIRQITKAMQFDPSNLKNVETRIRLTGDRMQSLQSKVQITKTAMQQLGDSVVKLGGKDKSVRDIVNETDNLSLKAKQADERFNGLTKTLSKIYEAWNKKAREKGVDFARDELGISAETADYLMRTNTSMRDFRTELENINRARQSGLDLKPVMDPGQLATLTKLKELNFHGMFKNGLELDEVVQSAKDLGIVLEDSAIANVRELQKTFKEAQTDKKAFDDALTFEQMGTDLQRLNSEAESLSQTMRKLDDALTPTSMSDDFQAIETQIRTVDSALDNVERDLKRTGDALKIDPGNVGVAARYFSDLQQKAELSKEKVALLKQEMELLDADGASEAAKGHEDLAKWIEESAESARTAQKELSDQQAAVANLDDQVKNLNQSIANMKGDSTLAQYSDTVQQWKTRTEQLTQAMESLKTAEGNVATQQKKLGEAQDAFDKAKSEADEYKKKLTGLKKEYEQLNSKMSELYASGRGDLISPSDTQRLFELVDEINQVETAYGGAKVNVEEFSKKLRSQKKDSKEAQDALEKQKGIIEGIKKSVSELEKTREVKLFQNPTGEIEKVEGELKDLQGDLEEARAKEKELAETYKAAKTENELAKTSKKLHDLEGDAHDAATKLKEAEDALKGGGSSILNASTVKSLGMTLSATLTPTVTAIGYKMADASSTVDSAYRDMRKTVEGTEEQFEHLRKAAVDFSRTHVTSADQILSIEAIGGELGIATDNLETFAEVISNLDVATNLNTEDAATALGHLSNILHLTEDDYVGFSDALVRLGNNGASTESEIANIAERIGAMGSIVGMSGSDILAWSSSIASTGQNAEAAGTAISKTMSFMETAVAAAGGTLDTSFDAINAAVEEGGDKLTVFASMAGMTADEFSEAWATNSEEMASELNGQLDTAKNSLQKIADIAHMSADEFAKTWESDPTKAMKAFIDGLNDVEGAEGSADKVLQDLGITAVRQKQAIEGLMQTVGGLDNNLKMSEDAWNGVSDKWGQAGDAANEAQKKAEGFSGQLQILKNMSQNFLSELGEGAVPWIQMFTGVISGMSEKFSSLSTETKKWLVLAGGIGAALGPALSIGATLVTSTGELKKWFKETTDGMSLVQMVYRTSNKVISESMAESMTTMQKVKIIGKDLGMSLLKGLAVGAVIAGIVLIAFKLKELYDRYKDHEAATKGLANALADVGRENDVTISSFNTTGSRLRELAADSNEYESRLANLTRTLEDSNRQYGNYAGTLSYYSDTIKTLGSKADLSQEEAYKLEAALTAVNDACGTTYGLDNYGNIIDTQTGQIQKNTDEILANIDARKQQAIIDYYSDDYTQAVGELTEAQDKLNEATDKYEELASAEGKKKFLDHVKEVYGANYDATQAQATYNKQLEDAKTAMNNYQREVTSAQGVVDKLDGKIAGATEELDKANKALEEAAKAQEEFDRRNQTVADDVTGNMKRMSDAATQLGKSDADFNNIADGLSAIHVSAEEMNNVDMGALITAFDSVGGSMDQVIATLENGGVQMNTWNAALEQAPGAAENMSSLTAAAFQSMYEVAGNDINNTMTLIAGLDMVQVGDKTFYIGDNGSIVDSQGKIYNIQTDLANIPDSVITQFYVNDEGAAQAALDAKAKLEDVGKQTPTPTIEVKDNASGKTKSLQTDLNKVGAARPTPTVRVNDYASGKLGDISAYLRRLNGMSSTVYVTTVEKKVKQATGGMNSRPVIPRHATGYIATGPTLTNQGWIGEDGIEAVANWATGGAVVPLTNKRYMLPIADAIADGMVARGAGGQAVGIDYDLLGQSVAAALMGMSVTIDGQALVGEISTRVQRASRFYAG